MIVTLLTYVRFSEKNKTLMNVERKMTVSELNY